MNGFASHGLDEDAFGQKRGNIVQAFDAFRMSLLSNFFLDYSQAEMIFSSAKCYNWIDEHELIPSQPKQNPNM